MVKRGRSEAEETTGRSVRQRESQEEHSENIVEMTPEQESQWVGSEEVVPDRPLDQDDHSESESSESEGSEDDLDNPESYYQRKVEEVLGQVQHPVLGIDLKKERFINLAILDGLVGFISDNHLDLLDKWLHRAYRTPSDRVYLSTSVLYFAALVMNKRSAFNILEKRNYSQVKPTGDIMDIALVYVLTFTMVVEGKNYNGTRMRKALDRTTIGPTMMGSAVLRVLIEHNHVECIKWFIKMGIKPSVDHMMHAVSHGSLPMVLYFGEELEIPCPWSKKIGDKVITDRNEHAFRCIEDINPGWSDQIFDEVVEADDVETFKFIVETCDYDIDEDQLPYSLIAPTTNILQYLHEHDYDIHDYAKAVSVAGLKYLKDMVGVDLVELQRDDELLRDLVQYHNRDDTIDRLRYLESIGVYCDDETLLGLTVARISERKKERILDYIFLEQREHINIPELNDFCYEGILPWIQKHFKSVFEKIKKQQIVRNFLLKQFYRPGSSFMKRKEREFFEEK